MMLRPIQEEEEEGKFAQRRAKALGADMKTIAKGEADKAPKGKVSKAAIEKACGSEKRSKSLTSLCKGRINIVGTKISIAEIKKQLMKDWCEWPSSQKPRIAHCAHRIGSYS